MLSIVVFALLWYRMVKFGRLTAVDLPGATPSDLEQMRGFSRTAFYIMLGFTVASVFIALVALATNIASGGRGANVLGLVGLIVACIFDYKAESVRKRCQKQSASINVYPTNRESKL